MLLHNLDSEGTQLHAPSQPLAAHELLTAYMHKLLNTHMYLGFLPGQL